MARRCTCSNRCKHWSSASVVLVPSDRLQQLAPVLATLIDAADLYDQDALQFDPACRVHGDQWDRAAECTCEGERTTALEFVQALVVDVRSAAVTTLPAGRPNRKLNGTARPLASIRSIRT